MPGATVTYTITVANTGHTPYSGATVTDSLNGVLADAAYGNDAAASVGTVSYASPDLTWTGDLAPGDTATITYTVTVHNPDTGGKLMVNFVTSADPGSTCPFDSPNPGCAVTIPVLTPARPSSRPLRRPAPPRASGDLHRSRSPTPARPPTPAPSSPMT